MAGSSDANALILQVSADVSKLQKQFEKAAGIVDSGSKRMENRAKKAQVAIEGSFTLANVGKAIDRIFGNTRLKVFDSAAARFGVTGKALELLGSTGLVAAAGVVAVGAAFAEARGAAKFADDILGTAARLHITTDALQEFRYANFKAGGAMEGADHALEAFSGNLGLAQEGLKKGQRAFLALGFTKAQILSFTDADSALKAVTQRIAELKSDPQKDALIDQLGLTGMKPLILEGVGAMEALRQKAHEVGIVMDADLIERGATANKEFEVLSKVIDVQLKSAFIDLAPVLIDLLKFAADLAKQINAIADTLRSVENKSNSGLLDAKAKNTAVIERLGIKQLTGERLSPTEQNLLLKSRMAVMQIDSQVASRAAAPPPSIPHGTRTLIDQGSHPKGPKPPQDRSTEALDAAQTQELQARLALLQEVYDQTDLFSNQNDKAAEILQLQKDEIDVETKKKNQTVTDAKNIDAPTKKLIIDLNTKAGEEAKQLADKKAQTDLVRRELEATQYIADLAQRTASMQADVFDIQAGLAKTAADRLVFELASLKIRQDLERKEIADRYDALRKQHPNTDYSADQAKEMGPLLERQAAQVNATVKANLSPLDKWRDESLATAAQIKEAYQNVAVSGLDSLTNGITDAITGAKSLGQAFHDVANQIIADLIRIAVRKYITSAIANVLFPGSGSIFSAAASGGSSSSSAISDAFSGGNGFSVGGYTGDGGTQEVAGDVHGQEFVVNAAATRSNRQLLESINAGHSPVFSNPMTDKLLSGVRGGQTIIERTIVVRTSETPYFTTKIESAARARATEAGITATRTSMQATPAEMRRRAVQSLG